MRAPRAIRSTVVIGLLTVVCLATFLATIPLPRADGQLLGGDGFGYYVYLPSLVVDGDLDLGNEFALLGQAPPPGSPVGGRRAANLWPVGPAMLWLPFFLLAHALATVFDALGAAIPLNGCGYWHQAFVIAGNIVYGGTAIALARRVAARVASAPSALWATVIVVIAGNLVYYMTAEPSMSHPVSAFAVSAFYAAWTARRGTSGWRRAAALGALAGLTAVVRAQDTLLLVVPFATDAVAAFSGARHAGDTRPARAWARDAVVTAGAALLVCVPQFLISQALFGNWWSPPQVHAAPWGGQRLFSWWSPHVADALISARRGLFAWHPVFALSMLGIVPLWKKDRALASAVLVGVLGEAYVIGGWFDWWQGRAFGGRTFISCLPLFAAALAALGDSVVGAATRRRRLAAGLAASLAAVLVVANLLLFLEYRFVLSRTDRAATWHDLGTGRVTFFWR